MDTTILTIGMLIISTIIATIGYFLKTTYNDVKHNVVDLQTESRKQVEDHGKLKGKLELLEQEHRLKFQLIEESTQHEIRIMASKIGDLSDTVGELVRIQMHIGESATRAPRRRTN